MATDKQLVMVVDDDVDFLNLYREMLERAGYEVVCCSELQAAFASVVERRPDLIITDLMMESLDAGFSLSRQIKEDPVLCGIPVIIVTAAGSQRGFDFRPRSEADLAAMRVDAFLEKPVSPKNLLAKVAELLAQGRP